jgi:hypothetical protein
VNTNCRIYRIDRETGVTEDKAVLEWHRGCNGVDHVDLLHKVWYKHGRHDYAELLTQVHRGRCDGLCTPEELGGFVYPFPDRKSARSTPWQEMTDGAEQFDAMPDRLRHRI